MEILNGLSLLDSQLVEFDIQVATKITVISNTLLLA